VSTPTAGEVVVHRCVVRVVRRGGWSWGPDPRGLVQRAIEALPDLLAEEFDEILAGDGPDVEITEPVRLSVRLSVRPSSRPGGGGDVLASASVVLEPTGSIPVPVPVASPVDGSADPSTSDPPGGLAVPVRTMPPPTPTALFGELAERGELAAVLALLPDETLRVYLSALLPASPAPSVVGDVAAELARPRSLPSPPSTLDEVAELVRSLPPHEEERSVPAATETPVGVVGETRVCAALPFLLAGPLARTGYLDAIGPALSGVDSLADAPLFAAALAYKVLGAPERGWRRTPHDNAAAAAFAGLDSVPDLTEFAQRVRPALPVLDGVLALSLCRGHDPADPLLVTGVDDGLLLVDAQGMFPVAWAPSVAGLLPHWVACGRPPVLVCDSPLPTSSLRDLAGAGVRFVTNVRPLRGDPVARLPWRTPLWTSGDLSPRLAAELPVHAERVADLVEILFVAHRAVPRADGALDRSVSLAASLSLGMLAWQLWPKQTPDPVLALTRFADLEARVEYRPESVRVKLPLGRRHTDLWQGGALTDVPNVVWLGGRTLTFSGG